MSPAALLVLVLVLAVAAVWGTVRACGQDEIDDIVVDPQSIRGDTS